MLCPEPVLANGRFSAKQWRKKDAFHTAAVPVTDT
jgi:hypothetical protein